MKKFKATKLTWLGFGLIGYCTKHIVYHSLNSSQL
jgi:hypothetical protein